MNNNEVILVLNSLISTCKEGEHTFGTAAENVQNSEFRRLFNIFAQQRAQFVSELQGEVPRLGGDVPKAATPDWTNVKKMMARDEASIIAECQREEEAAVNDY